MNLTKLVIISFLLVCFTSKLEAQVNGGILGGLNFADLNIEDESSSRTVWGIGGVLDFYLLDELAIRVEPMYLKKGGIIEAEVNSPRIIAKGDIIEIPLFLKYEIGNLEKLYFLAGPTFGYVINNEIEAELNGVVFTSDITDNTEKLDIGIGFGAGLQFPVSFVNIFLEGRYHIGLNNLQKGGAYQFKAGRIVIEDRLDVEDNKFKSQGFQLMVGITVPF